MVNSLKRNAVQKKKCFLPRLFKNYKLQLLKKILYYWVKSLKWGLSALVRKLVNRNLINITRNPFFKVISRTPYGLSVVLISALAKVEMTLQSSSKDLFWLFMDKRIQVFQKVLLTYYYIIDQRKLSKRSVKRNVNSSWGRI